MKKKTFMLNLNLKDVVWCVFTSVQSEPSGLVTDQLWVFSGHDCTCPTCGTHVDNIFSVFWLVLIEIFWRFVDENKHWIEKYPKQINTCTFSLGRINTHTHVIVPPEPNGRQPLQITGFSHSRRHNFKCLKYWGKHFKRLKQYTFCTASGSFCFKYNKLLWVLSLHSFGSLLGPISASLSLLYTSHILRHLQQKAGIYDLITCESLLITFLTVEVWCAPAV